MDRINFLKFILVALAIPTQYLVTQYWSNNNVEQSVAWQNLVISMQSLKQNYFELEPWKKWYLSFVIDKPSGASFVFKKSKQNKKDSNEDDIAVEVLTYRKELVHFAESSRTRSPRSSKILYRVGQVVYNKRLNIHGVIIGWDESCKAPNTWIERNYDESERDMLMSQPHYLLLVDEKDQKRFANKVYVYQDDLEKVINYRVKHRILSSFFSSFDGGQYIKKKYLQTVYPHD